MAGAEIFSLCLGGFPGTNRALRELSRAVGLSRHHVLSPGARESPEVEFFRRHLLAERPKLTIFGGWSDAYEPLLRALNTAGLPAAIYWTSSPGQVDIAGEMEKLSGVLHDPRIQFRFFVSTAFANSFRARAPQTWTLPNLLDWGAEIGRRPAADGTGDPVNVSLFGLPRAHANGRKNALVCLLALAGVKGGYRLHLNGLSEQPAYGKLLTDLEIPFVDHGWMEELEYHALLDTIDLGLQVSFAESFSYVTAEHLQRAIPVIGSEMVPCLQGMPAAVRRRLVIRDAGDPAELRARIGYLLQNPEQRRRLGASARRSLYRENRRQIDLAASVLQAALKQCV